MSTAKSEDIELHIEGIVQGVGFRPFVYRLAQEFAVCGNVANTADGVIIQLLAPGGKLADFILALRDKAPVMAQVTAIKQYPANIGPHKSFSILESTSGTSSQGVIPPDTAICADCLHELLDPSDRRYEYPFINCTNCGPRFTIVANTPYDRTNTCMADFTMCDACLAEYQDPASRRFHAEPNACADCGPSVSWHNACGERLAVVSPIQQAATALKDGKIIAIRGLGGFHLAVDADNAEAVARLRQLKGRPEKPLAVMFADLATMARHCHINSPEAELANAGQRAIIILAQKEKTLAANLAPGIMELGAMLPYTPLHYLLFAAPSCPAALVMTSGNKSGAPICTKNEQALAQLSGVADFFLLHNRAILTRADDSVVRYMAGSSRILRRSRGYVPRSTPLPHRLPELIACGGQQKNTFCLTKGDNAYISQHIGELGEAAAHDFYTESIDHLRELLAINPIAAVCDMHPDYQSSRYAKSLGLPLIKVQHHHAHAAAVMAEHKLAECIAVVLDGSGWGRDNTIWGGEILRADLTNCQRLGHLQTIPMPGGDKAAREGWRLGLAATWLAGTSDTDLPPALQKIPPAHRQTIYDMLAKGINCPLTSSAGRLFDTVAAILGVRQESTYEGQAAMELEANAAHGIDMDTWLADDLCLPVAIDAKKKIILSIPMLEKMIELGRQGDTAYLARQFHLWLCRSLSALLTAIAPAAELPLVLTGGCMMNRLLFEGLISLLRQQNYIVYSGVDIPVNDGGLALGQAVIGGELYVSGRTHAGY